MNTTPTDPVLDANGDPVPALPEDVPSEAMRAFFAGRVPARDCPHYIAQTEARAGFTHCENCKPPTRGRYRKSRRLTHPLTVAVAFVAGLVLLVGACSADDRTPTERRADEAADAEQAAYDSMTELERARDDCENPVGIETADAGHTLLIDHRGEDETTGANIEHVVCVFFRLGVPDSLLARIDSTRALDGTQSGEWDGYTAVWSYHPDSGMNIIIEDAS